MAPREPDLVVVACCCAEYVHPLSQPARTCPECGLTPSYQRNTVWWLGTDWE